MVDVPHAVDETRSLTFANLSGDGTLAWAPASDDVMRELIERKMKEGYVFWILHKRMGGLRKSRERVVDVEKAMASRSVVLSDADFAAVVSEGAIQLVRSPAREPLRDGDATMSRDPAAIAASQSVAVRQYAGG